MNEFKIDFFELAFLAEACIPPTPIARAMFWQNLTNKYWNQMTEGQRAHLFDWLNKNPWYPKSLESQEDTKIFHARFDPDNQYMVHTNIHGVEDKLRVFKMSDRYYITCTTYIADEYIVEVNKFTPEIEY
jgi:hypothetical protein